MEWSPERELTLRFQIDTNRINARRGLVHMNRLEAWHESELIEVLLSEPAFEELGADRERRRKGIDYIQTLTHAETDQEAGMLARIEETVFPGGARTAGERKDVEILFNAWKYSACLITADGGSKRQPGGILGATDALASLGIVVLTDEQACALVERRIGERDDLALEWSRTTGQPVPHWVGTDN